MKPLLDAQGITKIFGHSCGECLELTDEEQNICPKCGAIVACANITFSIFPGEAVGIVGESGSGKSTLIRILALELEATKGTLRLSIVDEDNLLTLPPFMKKKIKNHLIGVVYQNPLMGLRMNISAEGNIAEILIARGFRHIETIRSTVLEIFRELELPPERRTDPVRNFSGGMQQKVQIGRALASNPAIIMLDEPTTGLDPTVQAKILDIIKDLYLRKNFTLLVVSHDLGVIRLLTDRVIVMKNGRIVELGSTDQILEDPQHPYTQILVTSQL